jgi:hypothetical protein
MNPMLQEFISLCWIMADDFTLTPMSKQEEKRYSELEKEISLILDNHLEQQRKESSNVGD